MYKPTQEKFTEEALHILQSQLAKDGVIIRQINSFKDAMIKIGELYYRLKKQEEL